MTGPPDPDIYWTWDGRCMLPLNRFSRLAEKTFTSGHAYQMIVQGENERSPRSHKAYFAAVHEAWMNLPEQTQLAFPTPEHLRRFALIKAGFCDIKHLTGKGKRHVAIDGYAVVTHDDGVTTVHTAKSQSYRAMGKAEFERSKTAVLDILADMIGTTADQLMKERAA